MKLDEFAFVNLQLAGMLKCGIPLEGALKQLCATMRRGGLRAELEQLEADLARGVPLNEALAHRKLPELYVRLLRVGVASNDLPAMLTLLADHYQRVNHLWTRLKGLMVYPVVVLIASLVLSAFLTVVYASLSSSIVEVAESLLEGEPFPGMTRSAWGLLTLQFMPVTILGLLTCAVLVALATPAWRRWLLWRLPGFKEASLSRFASSLALLLRKGSSLGEALPLLSQLEHGTPIGHEVRQWASRLAEGRTRFADLCASSKIVPPLFQWLVAGDEDWSKGLGRAAEVYHARAAHRIEMMLYAALPVTILLLGLIITGQMLGMFYFSMGSGLLFYEPFTIGSP